MAEEKNIQKLSDDSLENVGGGFAGRDPYTIEEYNEAGVTHEHNIFSRDRYFYGGKQITQDEAEGVTRGYQLKRNMATKTIEM